MQSKMNSFSYISGKSVYFDCQETFYKDEIHGSNQDFHENENFLFPVIST